MRGIETEYIHEIEIKKSKFIALIVPIYHVDDVKKKLEQVKKDYPGATHYCYAYILLQEKRCSDDGEPSKTAGQPILNVLEKQQLSYVLAIVIRYFGGIKLGAGGLVRAYTNAVIQVLEKAHIYPMGLKKHIKVTFSYEFEQQFLKQYSSFEIIQKTYLDIVTYEGYLDEEKITSLLQQKHVHVEILESCYRILKD